MGAARSDNDDEEAFECLPSRFTSHKVQVMVASVVNQASIKRDLLGASLFPAHLSSSNTGTGTQKIISSNDT
jgi:hypothetical protein